MSLRTILLLLLLTHTTGVLSQKMRFKKDLVYLDNQPYVLLEKTHAATFELRHKDSKELMLEVSLRKRYNSKYKKTQKLPSLHFVRLDKFMGFEHDIKNKKELIRFLVDRNIILSDGSLNEAVVTDYYKYLESQKHSRKITNDDV